MSTDQSSTSKPPSKLTMEKLIFRNAHDLTPREFQCLAVILTYTDEHCRNAWPGMTNLMADLGAKDKKQVQKLLKGLKEKGYLHEVEKGGWRNGRNWATKYEVRVPARIMAKVLDAEEENPLVDNSDVTSDVSTGGVGVVSTPTGGVVSTPLSGPVSVPGSGHLNTCTSIADALPASQRQKDDSPSRRLHHEDRSKILDKIQEIAETPGANYSGMMDELGDLLEEAMTEDASYLVVEGKWTFHEKCADRYEAAAELNTLLNTTAREMGPEAIVPRTLLQAA